MTIKCQLQKFAPANLGNMAFVFIEKIFRMIDQQRSNMVDKGHPNLAKIASGYLYISHIYSRWKSNQCCHISIDFQTLGK